VAFRFGRAASSWAVAGEVEGFETAGFAVVVVARSGKAAALVDGARAVFVLGILEGACSFAAEDLASGRLAAGFEASTLLGALEA